MLEAGGRVHGPPDHPVGAGRVDLEIGETLFEPCEATCQNGFYLHVVGTAAGAGAWIGISTPSGSEFGRETGGDAALGAWFDELLASVGRPRTGESLACHRVEGRRRWRPSSG